MARELMEAWPKDSPGCAILRELAQPRRGAIMPFAVAAMGIHENIGVDGNHPPRPS